MRLNAPVYSLARHPNERRIFRNKDTFRLDNRSWSPACSPLCRTSPTEHRREKDKRVALQSRHRCFRLKIPGWREEPFLRSKTKSLVRQCVRVVGAPPEDSDREEAFQYRQPRRGVRG